MTTEKLFHLAYMGDVSILTDKDAAVVKNNNGDTPLHQLAERGRVEVLSHRDVAIIKNNKGDTPLHYLARRGKIECKIKLRQCKQYPIIIDILKYFPKKRILTHKLVDDYFALPNFFKFLKG